MAPDVAAARALVEPPLIKENLQHIGRRNGRVPPAPRGSLSAGGVAAQAAAAPPSYG